ncbi:hypothetical protein DPEC_G00294340 [Dallia pectoralis]|uniref:Uncharacterized protein n=1 Tax=Dallia pectoralis TaxID=75939 RepID=A0ACC2FIP1_DALPE|nr:hypothetical protein DPEC_G00294340 [Dallia pectoralis]
MACQGKPEALGLNQSLGNQLRPLGSNTLRTVRGQLTKRKRKRRVPAGRDGWSTSWVNTGSNEEVLAVCPGCHSSAPPTTTTTTPKAPLVM